MGEGEFKKRLALDEQWKREHGFTEDMDHMVANAVITGWVDEAKQEFPCCKCPFFNTDNCEYCSGLYKQFMKFGLKWFGSEENGE